VVWFLVLPMFYVHIGLYVKLFLQSLFYVMQAKALAEKSMRDRLVQKEQEERHVIIYHILHFTCSPFCLTQYSFLQRVAEALDADVKRWSSGKAGNLRALLSTLQYVRMNILNIPPFRI